MLFIYYFIILVFNLSEHIVYNLSYYFVRKLMSDTFFYCISQSSILLPLGHIVSLTVSLFLLTHPFLFRVADVNEYVCASFAAESTCMCVLEQESEREVSQLVFSFETQRAWLTPVPNMVAVNQREKELS